MGNPDDHILHGNGPSMDKRGAEILGSTKPAEQEYRIKIYDFKRPDRFSREQLRTLSIMHEEFCRLGSAKISATLQERSQMRVSYVDQLNFQEYLDSIDSQGVLAKFNMQGDAKTVVMGFQREAVEALVDCAAGAYAGRYTREHVYESSAKGGLSLSPLEDATFCALLPTILEELAEVWERIFPISIDGVSLMGKKGDLRFIHPSDMIVLIGCELKTASTESIVTLVLPYIMLESVLYKLSAGYYHKDRPFAESQAFGKQARNLPLEVSVYTPAGQTSLKNLRALKAGDLIPLPELDNGDLRLEAGSQDVFELKTAGGGESDDSTAFLSESFSIRVLSPEMFETLESQETETAVDPFATLTGTISSGFSRLENEFKNLARRQDEMMDTAFFAAAGEGPVPIKQGDSLDSDSVPLSFVREIKRELVLEMLANERAPLVARSLSYMDPLVAGDILRCLPQPLQTDSFLCYADLGVPAPFMAESMAGEFRRFLRQSATGPNAMKTDIPKLSAVLAALDRSTEKRFKLSLEKERPELFSKLIELQGKDSATQAPASRET